MLRRKLRKRLAQSFRCRENTQKLISEKLTRAGAGNAIALLSQLFYRPVVTVQQVSDIISMTYATANNLVTDLEHIGVLKEITGWGRNRRYSFEPVSATIYGR